MGLHYESNQEVMTEIAESIVETYLLTKDIRAAHYNMINEKYTAYEDLDKSIEEIFQILSKMNIWALSCVELDRESFSKDELGTLANFILEIEKLATYGFYTSAGYVLNKSAATLRQDTEAVQITFSDLFDILNLLEELN